jgi:NAD-dependent SIR2 family protein deacetylase
MGDENREIAGEVTYEAAKTEGRVILDRLHCTSCGDDHDIDNVEMTQDDEVVVAKCPDCDEILATFLID